MIVPAVPRVERQTAEVTAARALAVTWTGLSSSFARDSWDCSLTCPSVTTRPDRPKPAGPIRGVRLVIIAEAPPVWTGLDRMPSGAQAPHRVRHALCD